MLLEKCETSLAPNLGQVLYLLHSDELQRKIGHKEGVVAQLLKDDKPSAEIVEEIFLRACARRPSAEETTDAVAFLEKSPDRKAAVEDLLWTLLNSKEFLFNH